MDMDTLTGTDMGIPTATDAVAGGALLRLMTWLSPSFPVGAFAYSHGIEYAVEAGFVRDCPTLIQWMEGVLVFGAGRIDAALFRAAWEAATKGDDDALAAISERADILRGTAELSLESASQGRAFLNTVMRVWPYPGLDRWHDALSATGREPAYAVAVGIAAALAEAPLKPALSAYLHAFAANLVSAGVRLVPLGQTDGQKAMAALEPGILSATEAALDRAPDDIGGASVMVDWTSMQHETQYSRLFRS